MLTRTLCVAALLFAACQDSGGQTPKGAPAVEAPPPKAAKPPPPPPPPDASPPDAAAPLPTDPKQLAELRKKAILDARYDLAMTICAAEDMAKLDDQSVMSCVLSACRQSDVDKSQAWAKHLEGPLKAQAKKICAANKVPL